MSASKSIQIILARQLASCVAMPILLVDAAGTLIFYNEPAEAILNQRFEETGEIPVEEWNRLVAVTDEERHPIPPENWPMRVARLQRRPISGGYGYAEGAANGGICRSPRFHSSARAKRCWE
jgi:PAS domain-containing protein